ncbi:MAG: NUDIX hydrolase [Anaerolineaceae bacterium]|nr:NUDIX hydrolase [Anaerolineaceae bacterium]
MADEKLPLWLQWARRLQAISQSGLFYSQNDFDIERFKEIQHISADILQNYTSVSENELLTLFNDQVGYATPKVTVRAAVFNDHRILLVREKLDARWSMPGGWADINDPPSRMIEREVFEESGFVVKAKKLISVHESNRDIMPLTYWHNYKLVFMCELIGGEPKTSIETTEIKFFPLQDIPELSPARNTLKDIEEAFYFLDHKNETTYFD